MNVIDEIAAERQRQIEAEGWTPEHDDSHDNGELASAAACYAAGSHLATPITFRGEATNLMREIWPWAISWWKPRNRRHDLVRAAALIVAEIERLDRAATLSKEPTP